MTVKNTAKRSRITGVVVALGLALGAAQTRAADLVDGVAAVVDNEVILLSEVEAQARQLIQRVQQQDPSTPVSEQVVAQLQRDALRRLIDQKVVKKFAARVDLAATPDEIDQAIKDIAASEKVTPDDIYAAAAAEGLGREQYRDELAANITQVKVISGSVRGRVRVSPEDIKQLFDERYGSAKPGMRARVRQILIPWPGPNDKATRDQARDFAQKIRQRAIDSRDFGAVAKQASAAPSAPDGGLTVLRQGEVDPAIEKFVFEPPLGSISPVVENEVGLNIFQVLERFDPSTVQLKDVEDSLRGELQEKRLQPEFEKWLTEQRAQYYIKVVGQND